jgi:biopolymer transport protein ExbD
MRSSKLARRLLRNHARYRGRNDLTIVPMLDIMVILTFFLIFTAVFSRTSILEVHLPGPGGSSERVAPTLELEVILRRDRVEVADRNVGVLESLAAREGQQDLAGLAACLEAVKRRYPDQSAATLLVAEDVDYDTIVQVMDAMRLRQVIDGGKVARTELFPQIALGDAPT